MEVKEITEVKNLLTRLKNEKMVQEWELPYENLLTRLSAAIFFITPHIDSENIWTEFQKYPNFNYRENIEKKLSQLKYRIEFNK